MTGSPSAGPAGTGDDGDGGEPTTGAAASPDDADPASDSDEAVQAPQYVESTIIMTTVRAVSPFVLTFGLFVMLHGADSPGGGFQGGVVAGAVVMMVAFAFGIDATRDWVSGGALTAVGAGGVLTFASIGFGSLLLGGAFLEYGRYADLPVLAGLEGNYVTKYGIELVELSIGAIVAGVVVGLFFVVAAGFGHAIDEGGDEA